jgi:hypothetical protein
MIWKHLSYYSSGSNNTAIADGASVKKSDLGTDPAILTDGDTHAGHALKPDRF